MLKELEELYEECKVENWDGYNAFPVLHQTYLNSIDFLTYLISNNLEPTSLSAECDGCITFEWYLHPKYVLSVSIDSNKILYYAALINKDTIKGQEEFNRVLSYTLLDLIDKFK